MQRTSEAVLTVKRARPTRRRARCGRGFGSTAAGVSAPMRRSECRNGDGSGSARQSQAEISPATETLAASEEDTPSRRPGSRRGKLPMRRPKLTSAGRVSRTGWARKPLAAWEPVVREASAEASPESLLWPRCRSRRRSRGAADRSLASASPSSCRPAPRPAARRPHRRDAAHGPVPAQTAEAVAPAAAAPAAEADAAATTTADASSPHPRSATAISRPSGPGSAASWRPTGNDRFGSLARIQDRKPPGEGKPGEGRGRFQGKGPSGRGPPRQAIAKRTPWRPPFRDDREARAQRERQPDPDSPFAKLLGPEGRARAARQKGQLL